MGLSTYSVPNLSPPAVASPSLGPARVPQHTYFPPHSPSGLPTLPPPLLDLRPLSPDLPTPTTLAREGANYYWFFRVLFDFERWAPCYVRTAVCSLINSSSISSPESRCGNLLNPPPPAEGWTAVRTLYVREPGHPPVDIPFVCVFRKGTALVVLVKGDETGEEWLYGEWMGL